MSKSYRADPRNHIGRTLEIIQDFRGWIKSDNVRGTQDSCIVSTPLNSISQTWVDEIRLSGFEFSFGEFPHCLFPTPDFNGWGAQNSPHLQTHGLRIHCNKSTQKTFNMQVSGFSVKWRNPHSPFTRGAEWIFPLALVDFYVSRIILPQIFMHALSESVKIHSETRKIRIHAL